MGRCCILILSAWLVAGQFCSSSNVEDCNDGEEDTVILLQTHSNLAFKRSAQVEVDEVALLQQEQVSHSNLEMQRVRLNAAMEKLNQSFHQRHPSWQQEKLQLEEKLEEPLRPSGVSEPLSQQHAAQAQVKAASTSNTSNDVLFSVWSDSSFYSTRLQWVLKTWAKDLPQDRFMAVGDQKGEGLLAGRVEATKCPPHSHWEGACCKYAASVLFAQERMQRDPNLNWAFFSDDDVYLQPERVADALHGVANAEKTPFAFGIFGCATKSGCSGLCGGGGFAVNRAAVTAQVAEDPISFLNQQMSYCNKCERWADQALSMIWRDKGVQFMELPGLNGWKLTEDEFNERFQTNQDLTFHEMRTENQFLAMHEIATGQALVANGSGPCVELRGHRTCTMSTKLEDVPFIPKAAGEAQQTPFYLKEESLLQTEATVKSTSNATAPTLPVAFHVSHLVPFVSWHCAPSLAALLLGVALVLSSQAHNVAMLLIFFGAQSFMGIYMKTMLTEIPLDIKNGIRGVPAAFLITAAQQFVSLVLLVLWMGVSTATTKPWRPRFVGSAAGATRLALLAVSFACNIAGNNQSLTLLPISVNLVIRACAPLTTLALRFAMTKYLGEQWAGTEMKEIAWMVFGTACSVLVVLSETHANGTTETMHMILGSILCLLSLFAASSELIMVSKANNDLGDKMTPLEIVFNTALPATLLLIPPSFSVTHPVKWPGHEQLTDWQIIRKAVQLHEGVLAVILLSGMFALAYNVLLYSVAQRMTPEYASLCSNFNKMLTIALSVLFRFEKIPAMPGGLAFLLGCAGTIVAFAIVSKLHQDKAKRMPVKSVPTIVQK